MIVIRMYQHGSGVKVRLEQHLTCCQDGGCSRPDEDATERAYPRRGAPPHEYAKAVAGATSRLWASHSNVSLVSALCYHEPIPGL